jgi:hypothetical protein
VNASTRSLREWQSALARMVWEGDRRQCVEFIATGEMPREIQMEIGRLLSAPRDAIHRLKIEVNELEARRLHTVVESMINGIEVDRASAGRKRDAGVHVVRSRGKGSRSKLFADRVLLTKAVNALRDAKAAWGQDKREAFDEAWSAGDPAALTLLEEIWRTLSRKSSPQNRS